jgi:hypothetical protein
MVEYVRGSEYDKWHWCKNCTQYPMYIYQKTPIKPPSDLCDQCKTKEEDEICQCEEQNRTTPERELKREIPVPYDNIL